MKKLTLSKHFKILILSTFAVVCLMVVFMMVSMMNETDLDPGPDSFEDLLMIASASPSCALSDQATLHEVKTGGRSEYILMIKHDTVTPVRLFKRSIIMGGYLLEGVSHDGLWRVEASVNHLSNDGTHSYLKSLRHKRKELLPSPIYVFC